MIGGSLSRRYAKALFQLALAESREEAVAQEIGQFTGVLRDPALNTVLKNPAFALQSRKKIVAEIARNLQLSPLATRFLSLLVERDRLSYFPAIVERYRRLLDEKKGQAEARVVAASPLEESDLDRLREVLEKVSAKRIVIQQESDPNLIGGLVIQLEGKIYDGSVRAQLDKIKKQVEQAHS
ncbi:MAG TPA: ATP synthase F1 subunit delta [Candidatus Binatia bacterium]|jgi:F-type H+-transporting ATPase subunit delta